VVVVVVVFVERLVLVVTVVTVVMVVIEVVRVVVVRVVVGLVVVLPETSHSSLLLTTGARQNRSPPFAKFALVRFILSGSEHGKPPM